MPFVRRRPLMRAAAVGGVAYMGSRAGANRAMQNAQAQAAPAPPTPPPAAPAEAAGADKAGQKADKEAGVGDRIAMLQQLAQLHDSGALTDEEFAAEKAKVLG